MTSSRLRGRCLAREALATPESTRTAEYRRWPLGSLVLTHSLNLADALSRLLLSPLTRVGMARIASLRETPAAEPAYRWSLRVPRPLQAYRGAGACDHAELQAKLEIGRSDSSARLPSMRSRCIE